eukprot:snap_masked-scaffold_48-processed-gene-1.57-mRNA-1 protein AED:1.00 eAED:1.00 QI:0/0/0/0/1/1/3/0/289
MHHCCSRLILRRYSGIGIKRIDKKSKFEPPNKKPKEQMQVVLCQEAILEGGDVTVITIAVAVFLLFFFYCVCTQGSSSSDEIIRNVETRKHNKLSKKSSLPSFHSSISAKNSNRVPDEFPDSVVSRPRTEPVTKKFSQTYSLTADQENFKDILSDDLNPSQTVSSGAEEKKQKRRFQFRRKVSGEKFPSVPEDEKMKAYAKSQETTVPSELEYDLEMYNNPNGLTDRGHNSQNTERLLAHPPANSVLYKKYLKKQDKKKEKSFIEQQVDGQTELQSVRSSVLRGMIKRN